MLAILKELPEEDFFAIVPFESGVQTWRDSLQKATAENINEAMEYVRKIQTGGCKYNNERQNLEDSCEEF